MGALDINLDQVEIFSQNQAAPTSKNREVFWPNPAKRYSLILKWRFSKAAPEPRKVEGVLFLKINLTLYSYFLHKKLASVGEFCS